MIITQDIRKWAKEYEGEKFHSILADPPYALVSITKRFGRTSLGDDTYTSDKVRNGSDSYSRLIATGFMGQAWDNEVAFDPELWYDLGQHLYPGAYLLAFGGTRTFHRLACAIEDAGFEIRDTMMWIYGSGFPKSHNIGRAIDKQAGAKREVVGIQKHPTSDDRTGDKSPYQAENSHLNGEFEITAPATDMAKTWDGYGTALKPAFEPIIVARKPVEGTIANNCVTYGSGALNIDGCRVEGESIPINKLEEWSGFGQKERPDYVQEMNNKGRWPANLITDGSEEVLEGFPNTKSGKMGEWNTRHTDGSPNGIYGRFDINAPLHETIGDSGSAARFFYCAKVSPGEREAGCEYMEEVLTGMSNGAQSHGEGYDKGQDIGFNRVVAKRNNHPTLKPIALTEYLARLILPPVEYAPRRILIPFSGAGSEMIGAHNAGWEEIVGIELSEEYTKIAEARLKHWASLPRQMTLE